jgi:hypothetical protein
VLVLLLVIDQSTDEADYEHEHEQEQEFEKAVVIWRALATFPARERSKRFADLPTWSCKAGPNQRMRSRRS